MPDVHRKTGEEAMCRQPGQQLELQCSLKLEVELTKSQGLCPIGQGRDIRQGSGGQDSVGVKGLQQQKEECSWSNMQWKKSGIIP